jgi:hypothetical protein
MNKICKSPWCRVTFNYTERDMIETINDNGEIVTVPPKTCPKCRSFDNELSGGVKWVDKEYEGSRTYFEPQPFKYKITKYR